MQIQYLKKSPVNFTHGHMWNVRIILILDASNSKISIRIVFYYDHAREDFQT